MGYSLTWVGLKGISVGEACSLLNVERTGEYEEFPESPLTGVEYNGWFFLIGNDPYEVELAHYNFAKISRNHELVWCNVHEGVMYSVAESWKEGRWVWSVVHQSEKGITHLYPRGDFPAEFQTIRNDRFEKQEGEDEDSPRVDYVFDIPVELAAKITGYRYDRDIAISSPAFEKLTFKTLPSASKGRGLMRWVKGLLGK